MTTSHLDRRSFIAAGAAALPGVATLAAPQPRTMKRATVIASGNGLATVQRAWELMSDDVDPLVAIVRGVNIVENDPDDMSVGYGGLPNEDGVVELDAAVMHGPTHKAGAVASLRNIMNPASVALDVCTRTDHCMIVGDGALRFARHLGYEEANLLTDRAREVWLRWKANLNPGDDWLDQDQQIPLEGREQARAEGPIPFTYGTIHCSAVNTRGDLAGCTTTSGLSFKIPGRVGDSPIIGAGIFTDNEVGSAGATGRGESVIQSAGGFQTVQHMERGDDPTEACLKTLRWIARHTKRRELLNAKGTPNFNAVIYAVRKDGEYGSACMFGKRSFCVADARGARTEMATPCFE
ncbi:MAG: N(4)-(beta-N-acetylglucosaminyl)-L-asparaginase [Planctomycetota bacterium]